MCCILIHKNGLLKLNPQLSNSLSLTPTIEWILDLSFIWTCSSPQNATNSSLSHSTIKFNGTILSLGRMELVHSACSTGCPLTYVTWWATAALWMRISTCRNANHALGHHQLGFLANWYSLTKELSTVRAVAEAATIYHPLRETNWLKWAMRLPRIAASTWSLASGAHNDILPLVLLLFCFAYVYQGLVATTTTRKREKVAVKRPPREAAQDIDRPTCEANERGRSDRPIGNQFIAHVIR